ncbi:MAG: fructose-6-phosphate aldolase [Planctomycetes bacterium]|nr:fructose-6-phosphate aldolase [Planctomycetota bacterium]
MKFFLDTASVKEIREAAALGVLDGVTTNPTLVAKEKRNFRECVKEICALVDGPVSAEVVTLVAEEMVAEGRELAKIAKNVVVKVPLTKEGLKATRILSREGTRVNVTLCFSATQALIAAKAGASYISPFVGRLDDRGHDGMALIRDIKQIYDNYRFPTEILVASIRHPLHVVDAAKMGAHVATMPLSVFDKLIQHPLTDLGLEAFLADWKKVPQ